MNSMKNKLENNITGALVHGVELSHPYQSNKDKDNRQSAQTVRFHRKPEMNELDTMLKSYKPGLDDEERYRMMEHTGFYKTAYPNSAFNARL